MAASPKIVVLSAPSGAGKNTLMDRLRERGVPVAVTVSATTRAPRPGESHGGHYHFISRVEFESLRAADQFYEWAEVHGNLYGTLKSEVERCLASGDHVVLELDVQGMRQLRRLHPDVLTVFLMPPSIAELERRLRARGANSEDDIALRLCNAEKELTARGEFDFIVVNDDLDRAVEELERIFRG